MFIFLDFSLNTSRAIKKGGLKILKTEYAVFVFYKLQSKYKKSSKFEGFMLQNLKNCLISNGIRQVVMCGYTEKSSCSSVNDH
jgi:hypothetical protein